VRHHKRNAAPECNYHTIDEDYPCDWAEGVLCPICDDTDRCYENKHGKLRGPSTAASNRKSS